MDSFESPQKDVFLTLLQFYPVLAMSSILSQKMSLIYITYCSCVFLNHHFMPKALFFFLTLKYIRILSLKERAILVNLFYVISRYGIKHVFTVKFAR